LKRLIVTAEECAGCRHCELVCSFEHEGVFNPELSRIKVIKNDSKGFDYPVTCRNCLKCPPTENCPVNALIKIENGVEVKWWECIECGTCINQCTYNAIGLNKENKPIICDTCDGNPECVKRCPTQAIRFEETEFFAEKPNDAFKRMMEAWGIE
jgi:Fe-S-cluster-containing hydrogenase component 2